MKELRKAMIAYCALFLLIGGIVTYVSADTTTDSNAGIDICSPNDCFCAKDDFECQCKTDKNPEYCLAKKECSKEFPKEDELYKKCVCKRMGGEVKECRQTTTTTIVVTTTTELPPTTTILEEQQTHHHHHSTTTTSTTLNSTTTTTEPLELQRISWMKPLSFGWYIFYWDWRSIKEKYGYE